MSKIRITDPAFAGGEVGELALCEVDSEAELILASTDNGLGIAQSAYSVGKSSYSGFG